MDEEYLKRMARQLPILTTAGQKILHETDLCIIGCGGNGSLVSVAAALMGFTRIRIVDPDVLELSNLNRSLLFMRRGNSNHEQHR